MVSAGLEFYEDLCELSRAHVPFVLCTIVKTVGSVPHPVGGKMIVTGEGLRCGTIGGGKLEAKAIEEARSLLEIGKGTSFFEWRLDTDIGMTCGGSVKIFMELHDEAAWDIVIFGAGHCSAALISILVKLPCRIRCLDTRAEWLDRLPRSPRLTTVLSEDLASAVEKLPSSSYVVIMTMGHSTDLPILLAVLAGNYPYIGVIGSKAKAVRLKKAVIAAGFDEEATSRYFCPIGLDIGGNHPAEIAVSVAAQLLSLRGAIDNAPEFEP